MAILKLNNVCYSYEGSGEKKNVLNNVNCSFEQGKFYAIIGKSGSGKSTLLSLMAGLDLPNKGDVIFEGESTDKLNLDDYRKKSVSIVYQDFCLFQLLTALENIMYPMELCHVEKEKAIADAKELAKLVSLPENLLDRYPGKISGGEQQRVAVARALTMDRRLLLADEPTGNLDSENSNNIITLLTKLAHEKNKCVIVVTHDITVMNSADVVYLISDGTLNKYDSMSDILHITCK
ncbi:MAG TPA: ABC transporter ATP-binding protein [Eubacteriales bacterium]|nr:ABC transporter ATP-binding protein [Eubacteriales bacterium]